MRRKKMITMKNCTALLLALFMLISLPLSAQNGELYDEQPTETTVDDEIVIPQAKQPNFGRTVLEIGVIILGGTAWYYYDNSNKRDQVLKSKEDVTDNLTIVNVLKFDDNVFETNVIGHPLAGALYGLAARTNGYNQWQSFLFAFGGSFFWEYIVEFREIISINDMIQTPMGWVIGESLFQFASFYSAHSNPGWFSDFISGRVDVSKYKYMDGPNGRQVFNNMVLYAGVYGQPDQNSYGLNLGADMELFSVKKLKQQGRLNSFFFDTPYSHIILTASFGPPKGLATAYFFTETGLLGYAKQNIRSVNGERSGYSLFASLNTAFSYDSLYIEDQYKKTGIIHLLGPAVDVSLIKNDFILRLRSSLFGDFAQIHSAGLAKYYAAGHTKEDLENMGAITTASKGYYFAYGATYRQLMTVDYKDAQFGTEVTYGRYYSINGDGRTNEAPKTHNNFKMRDQRITVKNWFELKTFENTAIRFTRTYAFLKGSADVFTDRLDDSKYELNAIYRL